MKREIIVPFPTPDGPQMTNGWHETLLIVVDDNIISFFLCVDFVSVDEANDDICLFFVIHSPLLVDDDDSLVDPPWIKNALRLLLTPTYVVVVVVAAATAPSSSKNVVIIIIRGQHSCFRFGVRYSAFWRDERPKFVPSKRWRTVVKMMFSMRKLIFQMKRIAKTTEMMRPPLE
jgi:hypothetical protein